MATIANQYDPNNPNANQNSGGGGTVMPSTSGGTPSSGGGSTAGFAPQTGGTPSGQPGVQQYLNANQGAGQQLSQGIQNNVQNQANQVTQGVTNSQNQLNSTYQPLQQNLSQGQQVANSAFKDPQALLDSYNAAKTQSSSQPLTQQQQTGADQYNQFQKLNTGGYAQDIQNYGNQAQQQQGLTQNQLQQFNQNVPGANTEAGRYQLLQNAVNQPNYNQGQQTLDALFLQGQGNQLQGSLNDIKNQVGQVAGTAQNDVTGKIQALQGLSGQNQDYIKNLFTQGNPNAQGMGLNQIGTNVQNEYTQAQKNSDATNQQLQAALASKNLTPEQIQQLGLMPGQHGWGVDIGQAGHYTANPMAAANQGGYAQAATPEEFARYNALNQLAGGPAGNAQQSIFGTSQAAGGHTPFNFDTSSYNKAVADKQAAYQKDYQSTLPQLINQLGSVGHIGPGSIAPWDLARALQSGNAQGNMTPDQANDIIKNFAPSVNATGGVGNTLSSWDRFYNPYAAAQSDILGQTSPDTQPLPSNDKGGIDWSKIAAPKGK